MMAFDGRRAPLGRAGATEPRAGAINLVVRAQSGDAAAMHAFVRAHERAVFALLSRMLGPGPHVEDLAQECFLRAFDALGRFDPSGPASPSTWLLTIATRLALDARKRRRLPTVALDRESGSSLVAEGDPSAEHERRELGRALERAARELPDDQLAAFLLAELHGLSMAEIGEALGVPAETAKTRAFRARSKLRALLAPLWSPR